jgi:hypothetical protein
MVDASFVFSLNVSDRRVKDDPVGWVLAQLEAQGVWERES